MRRSWPASTISLRSEEHTSELQSRRDLVCRLLLEKKNATLGILALVAGAVAQFGWSLVMAMAVSTTSSLATLPTMLAAAEQDLKISFFFKGSAPPQIYTLSLHDALPIWHLPLFFIPGTDTTGQSFPLYLLQVTDRKSTRLNSSHVEISYAVFCLKKK